MKTSHKTKRHLHTIWRILMICGPSSNLSSRPRNCPAPGADRPFPSVRLPMASSMSCGQAVSGRRSRANTGRVPPATDASRPGSRPVSLRGFGPSSSPGTTTGKGFYGGGNRWTALWSRRLWGGGNRPQSDRPRQARDQAPHADRSAWRAVGCGHHRGQLSRHESGGDDIGQPSRAAAALHSRPSPALVPRQRVRLPRDRGGGPAPSLYPTPPASWRMRPTTPAPPSTALGGGAHRVLA
jgi:hypothetical protein